MVLDIADGDSGHATLALELTDGKWIVLAQALEGLPTAPSERDKPDG